MYAADNRQHAPAPKAAVPLGATAPSVTLPLMFVLTGIAALLTGMVWLALRPALLATYHYNQFVVAVTHLFVLGWICSVVMGAMYQLVPVALETKLYSERLARAHFAFHVVGVIGMVWMFHRWNMQHVGHYGTVLAVGVGLFAYNIARTLLRVPKWNVTATAVTAALGWISLTIIAGLSIATAKCTFEIDPKASLVGPVLQWLRSLAGFMSHFDAISAMHAHAHLGAVGFFTLLIVGVSYKLIPMFTLSEVQSRRRAIWSVLLLNAGLAGSFITILLRNPLKPAFAVVIVAALAIYGWELRAILRARKRRTLDWGIKTFLTAIALLLPLAGLAVVLSWPGLPLTGLTGQLENAYGFLGLLGVVTLAIIGMLYKVIPFLVWFGCYSRQIGRAHVPALADLYSSKLQVAGYCAYVTGIVATSAAIVVPNESGVRLGVSLLTLGVLTLVINVGVMLSHFFKLRLKPLAVSTSAAPNPA